MIAVQEEKKIKEKWVLIAEDDYMAFWLLSRQVCRAGGRVLWAQNGKEAVELCLSNPEIGLVFMDINMPVMDGFEATVKIKEIAFDLPVIVLTAFDYYQDKAYLAGCDVFLSKPPVNEQIEAFLKKYIKHEIAE
jgi:CheY-like chemotaxis protein